MTSRRWAGARSVGARWVVVAALVPGLTGCAEESSFLTYSSDGEAPARPDGEAPAPPEGEAPAPPDVGAADAATGRVVRIVDGDTAVVAGGEPLDGPETRVRLLEVDTPESVAPGQPVECWGPEATDVLAELLPVGSRVVVERDRDLLDPFGRTLLYVWNADGDFVNLELVRSGAAEAVLYEPNDRYIELLRDAEADARAEGRGRWGAC